MAFLPAQGGSVFKNEGGIFGAIARSGITDAIAKGLQEAYERQLREKQLGLQERQVAVSESGAETAKGQLAVAQAGQVTSEKSVAATILHQKETLKLDKDRFGLQQAQFDFAQKQVAAEFSQSFTDSAGNPLPITSFFNERGDFILPPGAVASTAMTQEIQALTELGYSREEALQMIVRTRQLDQEHLIAQTDLLKSQTGQTNALADYYRKGGSTTTRQPSDVTGAQRLYQELEDAVARDASVPLEDIVIARGVGNNVISNKKAFGLFTSPDLTSEELLIALDVPGLIRTLGDPSRGDETPEQQRAAAIAIVAGHLAENAQLREVVQDAVADMIKTTDLTPEEAQEAYDKRLLDDTTALATKLLGSSKIIKVRDDKGKAIAAGSVPLLDEIITRATSVRGKRKGQLETTFNSANRGGVVGLGQASQSAPPLSPPGSSETPVGKTALPGQPTFDPFTAPPVDIFIDDEEDELNF